MNELISNLTNEIEALEEIKKLKVNTSISFYKPILLTDEDIAMLTSARKKRLAAISPTETEKSKKQ